MTIRRSPGPRTRLPGRRPARRASRPRVEILEGRALLSGGAAAASAYDLLPLAFEANEGQAASPVDFLARGDGYALALDASGATLGLRQADGGDAVRLRLVGADPAARAVGGDELITRTNYLIGGDPSRWRTDIPNYGRVEYRNVYPGIDLAYYGNRRQLEYDFVVAPGADPGAIRLSIQGAESVALDAGGDLVLRTAGGDVVQHAPVVYQDSGGSRIAVAGQFVLGPGDDVGFRLGTYDPSRPLIIDPILSYSTYLGGSGDDEAHAIAVDAAGNAYLTGLTYSANLPSTSGAPQPAFGGSSDAFVAKMNASGTALVYLTYLGGSLDEQGDGIAVDASGDAYVAGASDSGNFPTTAGAFQASNAAGLYKGFVAELNASGTGLVYSTYLGGSGGNDGGNAIAVDGAGNAYVTGQTNSPDFPTRNPILSAQGDAGMTGYRDAFVTELNASGTGLVYSTYLGGPLADDFGNGIAVDGAGNAYVTGMTEASGSSSFPTTPGAFQATNATPSGVGVPFVTKIGAGGAALAYSTYLGGTTGSNDVARAIAVDASGTAYVAGSTQASDFPTTPGAFQRTRGGLIDAFVAALNASGTGLVYSTYLGGSGIDEALGIAVDGSGNASVIGDTGSTNFPTANAIQPTFGGGSYDAFAAKVNSTGTTLVTASYLGGAGDDFGYGIAVDSAGNTYLAGTTSSAIFPTTAGA